MTDRLQSKVLDIIQRSRRRVLGSRLAGALIDGLVFGLLACLAFGALAYWAKWGAAGWVVFFILLFLVLAGYVAHSVLVGTSLRAVAILLDEKLGYHDRISSALAFSRAREQTAFMQAHLRETAVFLEDRLDDVLPVPRLGRGRALVLFLVLGLVALLPHSDRIAHQQRDRREQVTRRVKATRNLAREMEQLRREADLRGLKKLSKMIAAVEEDLNRRLDLVTPEELEPPPPPEKPRPTETPGTTAKQGAEEEGLKPADEKVGSAKPGQGIHLSNVATYQPVGKFDSFPEEAYSEVFAELDTGLLDNQLTGDELANLAEHVDDTAGKIANFAFNTDMDLAGMEAMMSGKDADEYAQAGRYDPMEAVQAALQYRSFAEFLKRYASHLGEKAMGKARVEMDEKAKAGGEVFNVSAPPPKDGKYALRGVTDQPPGVPMLRGSKDQVAKLASQAKSMSQQAKDGTHTGAAGAGAGGSQRTGRVPAVLPQPEGGQYLPLEGKLGEGPAVIQVIDDRGRRNLSVRSGKTITYREVFVHYARGAEAELSSEQVPLHMRDYIRDYFRSIRPELEGQKDQN
ncbi:hypothetical protein ACFL2F_03385 [Myxococcota bacterium]